MADVKFHLGDEDDESGDVVPVMNGGHAKKGMSNGIPIPKKTEPSPASGSPSKTGALGAELAMSPRTMIRYVL